MAFSVCVWVGGGCKGGNQIYRYRTWYSLVLVDSCEHLPFLPQTWHTAIRICWK